MNIRQYQILRHTLGLDRGVREYRNHYAASPNAPEVRALVDAGLLEKVPGHPFDLGGLDCYAATQAGKAIARNPFDELARAPVFDLLAHLRRQIQFSEQTFGPGTRSAGVLDHIRKELIEIEESPGDLTGWIDVVMLALDGAWRAGYTPEQIAARLVEKQRINEARDWPDWRTAEPGKAIELKRG